MSLPALNASVGGAPPPAEHPRDPWGKSAGGSDFAAIVSALGGGDPRANARAVGTKAAASPQDRASTSEASPRPHESRSIDAGLAGLVYGALASPSAGTPSQAVPPDAGAKSATRQDSSGLNSAVMPPVAGGGRWSAWPGRGAGSSSDPTTGGSLAAALAGEGATASFAPSDVVDQPRTMQMLANGDASLGLGSIQSRTFLGVDSAARSDAGNPIARSQTRSAAHSTAPAQSAGTGTLAADAAAAASTRNEKRSTSGRGESRGASLAGASASGAPAAINPGASPGVINPGAGSVATGGGPVALDQLAERLAAEASGLASPPAASAASPATGAAGAQAVKELEIDLDPADLGAVSVKMRLTDGKLSVVMEVAKPSTLKAMENVRGAIADRLGSTAQPLETLIIKPTATNETSSESDNARDQKPGSQENAQNDPNREPRGSGQQPSRREGAAGQRNPQTMARQATSRGGFGDLLV